jgi:prepilin-type N-terminal cleavage/methylation domain-containing protein
MRSAKGFSLVELLIVVLVVTVIAAIAVPSLLTSRMAAHEAYAVYGLKTIGAAKVAYWTVNNNQRFADLRAIIEIVRTIFAAEGGEEKPPQSAAPPRR